MIGCIVTGRVDMQVTAGLEDDKASPVVKGIVVASYAHKYDIGGR